MMQVDFRDFIRPPFKRCPACKAQGFGLKSVASDRYIRQCRECGHLEAYPLPELKKTVIYLDQMAISNMMLALNPKTDAGKEGRVDPFWTRLFEKLDSLSKLQLIVCPDSPIQGFESALSPYYAALRRMYEHLSHGVSFLDKDTIARFQLATHIDAWCDGHPSMEPALDLDAVVHGKPHAWIDWMRIAVHSDPWPELREELRANKMLAENHLASLIERWRQESSTKFEEFFEREVRAFGVQILRQYDEFIVSLAAIQLGVKPPTMEDFNPPYAVLLVHNLCDHLERRGFSVEEANRKSREYLLSPELRYIPYNRISAALWASIARKAAAGMKKVPAPSTVNDIEVIASVMPYCDALFVDREMRSYLSEEPLASMKGCSARVFSASTRAEFMAYLDTVYRGAPAKHLALVNEVYGSDWTKPYLSMFTEEGAA
ncbi:MAG TPA: hypothetical protein VGK76_05435 [Candidatus Eisenbacteria bacterium]|jgi:hypothetical protein